MARGNVQVSIGGDVSGQIAIGNNNLQIQNQGGVVNIIKPSSRSPFKKRAGRIHYRPGSLPAFLDRIPESQLVQSSLQNRAPVSVFGESGIGKTTFLSQMAQLPDMDKYPDGVVYLYVPGKGLDDLLQLLFDTFYLTAGNVMPTAGQIRHRLRNVRAIILLDDLALSREDVQALITIMPLSCFVFASLERCLWGSGEVIPLRGLPEKEQVELFARELRRPVSEAEKADARIICFYLQGHPLQIIQAAALVTASGMTISDVKQQFQGTRASSFFEKALLGVLSVSQQKVLALLGTLSGTLLPLSIIGSVLKLVDTKEVLESLVQMGLAWQQGTDYGLAGSLARPISELWNLSSWETALIDYFSAALRQGPADALIQNTSDVLLKVIQKAAERNLWPQVVRLGRALEPFLILDKRWQAWHEVLSLVLKAARASGDPGTEAWALHQLGTRAMCLNFDGQALEFLRRALDLRRTIGDQQGLEVTQHNLDVLRGGAVVHESSTTQQTSLAQNGAGIGRYMAYGFGGMAGLGLLALIGWLLWNNPDLFPARTPGPVPTVMPSSIVTPSPTPLIVSATVTSTPTITSTSTETSTPTFTPTYTPTYTITPSFTPSSTPSRTPTFTRTFTLTSPPPLVVCEMYTTSPSPVTYAPPRVGNGDAEFSGHGPFVRVTVSLVQVDSRRFNLVIYMKAIEADSNRNPVYDYTEASGTMTINDFIVLPSGYLYGGLSYPKTIYSEGQYLDTDTDADPFRPGSNDDLVSTFIGDGEAPVILFLPGTPAGPGGEAGTYTKVTVYFNTMQFWVSRTGNCMTPTPGPIIP